MSVHTPGRPRRALAPLVTVTVATLVFAILLVLVRLQSPPLESVDHGAAAHINRLITGDHALVTVVKAVTWLGSNGVLCAVIGAAAVGLALRKRWRRAIYLLVTGYGATPRGTPLPRLYRFNLMQQPVTRGRLAARWSLPGWSRLARRRSG